MAGRAGGEAVTRAAFLAFFGLGAAGQSLPDPRTLPLYMAPNNVSPTCGEVRAPACGAPVHKPRNGECPVCGTMAKPYVRMDIGMEPVQRTVRCAHCSAAFWQDAEDVK